MFENDVVEHLIRTADTVAIREMEYKEAKLELDLLKARYQLHNEWEKLLGKKKPTVSEKEAYIKVETEELQRRVNELKIKRDYCRKVFEIHMLANRE